jgi:hypothetical protein
LYIHIAEICDSRCSRVGRKILRYFLIFCYLLKLTERQFWVTSFRCVFLSKMLIIQTNATHMSSKIVFYYTILHFRLPRSLIVRKISDTQKNTRFVCPTKIYYNLQEIYVMFRRIINILWTVSCEYYVRVSELNIMCVSLH